MVDVEINGMDQLLKKLKKLPYEIQEKVVKGAIRASAKPIVQDARRLVPKDSGDLKKSIGVVQRKSKQKNIVYFSVAPRLKKKHGFLAHFHEFGTVDMPAHPFMRPAFEAKGKDTIDFAKKYMVKRIDKELAKL